MNNVQLEQIGIVMILTGFVGMLGITGKIIYEEYGIDELIVAACVMIAAIGVILILITCEQ